MSDTNEKDLILIADDSEHNRQILKRILTIHHYETILAENGKEAVDFCLEKKPDLIIMDIKMPVMDGIEAAKTIKDNSEISHVPIIFVTAFEKSEMLTDCYDAGGQDFISKPFNKFEILARLKVHLELKKSRDEVQKSYLVQNALNHILCHDIMNHLTRGLLGPTMYKKGKKSAEEALEICENTILSLKNIVELVRTNAALSQGKLEINLKPMSLNVLVQKTLDLLDDKIKSKEIKINFENPGDCQVVVEHLSFVNSVLGNLLTNAVKFSHRGGSVSIIASKSENLVSVVVADEGIGMPSELVSRIFSTFEKTTRKGTDGEKGTGFGMPLVESFVKAYGGQIQVESTSISEDSENHGTKIVMTLQSA